MAQVNPCVQNCPQRSVSCHNGCQTYMRYKLMRLLMNKPCGMDDLRCTVCTRGQKWRWDRGGVE